jgi:hypothetical protein
MFIIILLTFFILHAKLKIKPTGGFYENSKQNIYRFY